MFDEAKAKAVLTDMNDGFHDAMQEAQKTFGQGIPLAMLARFFAIQIASICRQHPEFKGRVIDSIERAVSTPRSTDNG